ncbi:unnamed protein product, partial [Brachionus calyciflorus]
CGNKLPILLIIPRTKELENYTPPANIRILFKSSATFNEESFVISSFAKCGITGQSNLHKTLKNLVERNLVYNTYVDDLDEDEDILGFDNDDQIELQEVVLDETVPVTTPEASNGILSTRNSPDLSQIPSNQYTTVPQNAYISPNDIVQNSQIVTGSQVIQTSTPVISNESQRPRQLPGRYVLKDLINNNQNLNQIKSPIVTTSTVEIPQVRNKRGRKPLPRDENGKIIRPQKN